MGKPLSITLSNTSSFPDIFVAKFDPSGNTQWLRQYGATGSDYGYTITVDDNGMIYIAGTFHASTRLGDYTLNSATGANTEIFVAKLNASGTVLWAKNVAWTPSGPSSDLGPAASDIVTDKNGNLYVVGRFKLTSTFGPGFMLTSSGQSDIFIAKYNASNGNVRWVKKAGGSGYDKGYGVTLDNNGDVVITGHFEETATFQSTSLTSSGNDDVFVTKYAAASGTLIWAESFGGPGRDTGRKIAADADGNIFLTGEFRSEITIADHSFTSLGSDDIFIVKYDASGDLIWANQAGGTGTDYASDLITDADNNLYITGRFQNEITLGDLTGTSYGSSDIFVAKYDNDGDELWIENAGSTNYDEGKAVGTDADKNIYIACSAALNSTFGSLTKDGDQHISIAKIEESDGGSCPTINPTITADGPTEICEGNSVILTASSGYPNYTWSNGETTQSITVTEPGDHSVEVSDCTGCSGKSETVSITQASDSQPVLSVTPPSQSVSADAGETTVSVANTGTGEMRWTVTTDVPWLTVIPTWGTDDETLTVRYEANIDDERTGSIKITADGATGSPETVTVIQEAVQPVLSVTPHSHHLVSPDSGKVVVVIENTGTGTMSWTAEIVDDVPWLLIEGDDFGDDDGMLTVSYESNLGEARTGMIRITASGATKTVEVRQDGFGVTDGIAIDMDISTDSIEPTVQASEGDEIWIGLVAQETAGLYSFQADVNFDSDKIGFLKASEDNPSDGPDNFLQPSIGLWAMSMDSETVNISNMLTVQDCDLSPDGSGHIAFLQFHVSNMDSEIYLDPANVMFINCNDDSKLITSTSLSGGVITPFSRYDLNEDGVTDALDLEILREHLMETEDDPEWDPKYNLKTDPSMFPGSFGKQIIDIRDVQVLVQNFTP